MLCFVFVHLHASAPLSPPSSYIRLPIIIIVIPIFPTIPPLSPLPQRPQIPLMPHSRISQFLIHLARSIGDTLARVLDVRVQGFQTIGLQEIRERALAGWC